MTGPGTLVTTSPASVPLVATTSAASAIQASDSTTAPLSAPFESHVNIRPASAAVVRAMPPNLPDLPAPISVWPRLSSRCDLRRVEAVTQHTLLLAGEVRCCHADRLVRAVPEWLKTR